MRPIIYPAAEELIRNKKQQKLAERVEEEINYGNTDNRSRGKS
jgi:hypothetical protein